MEYKKELKNNRWVDVPMTGDVWHLLKEQRVADTYYRRGDGQATQDLDWVEALHRNWVHELIDLSDFEYCYGTNGATEAINQWLLHEEREYQYFQGEYEYPSLIKPGTEVCTGYKEYTIDPNKVLYVSNPSAADGNFFNLDVDCFSVCFGDADTDACGNCGYYAEGECEESCEDVFGICGGD